MIKRCVLTVAVVIAFALVVFFTGFQFGVYHAICDSEIYTDNQFIYIELNDSLYVHEKGGF